MALSWTSLCASATRTTARTLTLSASASTSWLSQDRASLCKTNRPRLALLCRRGRFPERRIETRYDPAILTDRVIAQEPTMTEERTGGAHVAPEDEEALWIGGECL